jgi:ABC-type proline/glycine betaine transport system permease subunit
LLELRRREAAGASDYTGFRRRYVERIAAYIEKVNIAGLRPADVREIDRQYGIDMKADLRLLKQELRLAAAKVVFRDIGIAVVAAIGATAIHPLAGLSGVGALLHSRLEYRQARRAALQKSAMSWLYLSEPSSMLR